MFEEYYRQTFSFPDSMVFYITKNPSTSEAYLKLIQTCKYFFAKNPILVVHGLKLDNNEWQICSNDSSFQKLSFNKLYSKIWITSRLQVYSTKESRMALSKIFPNLFRCEAEYLHLEKQVIPFNTLLLLSKNVTQCHLANNNISECEVTSETIVATFPKLKRLLWWGDANSVNVKELLKISRVKDIEKFVLLGLSEKFDIETFFNYIKENGKTRARLFFFRHPLSDAFKDKLNKIVDEIINTNVFTFLPPYITFNGMNELKKKALSEIYSKFSDV